MARGAGNAGAGALTMQRFYVPQELVAGATIQFNAAQARQIARVLRLRAGDGVEVFDGRGGVAAVQLLEATPGRATGAVHAKHLTTPSLPFRAVLHLALIRPQRFEIAIEKAAELGVYLIVPLVTSRTAHGAEAVSANRMERWRQIAIEAAEQCGSAFVTAITAPLPLAQALRRPEALRLLAFEGDGSRQRESISSIMANTTIPPAAELGLFVGPEGGFTAAEVAAAIDDGCRLITLGRQTLRAETAAIAALAVLVEAAGKSERVVAPRTGQPPF